MNITDKLARLLGQAIPMLKSFHASNTDALAAAAQNALAEYEAALASPAGEGGLPKPAMIARADGRDIVADPTGDSVVFSGDSLYTEEQVRAIIATPSQPGSSVQERRLAPWPDYAGNPIYEGDTIKHPADGATGVVFVLANETDDHDRWRVLYNGDGTPARASRLCLQIDYKGQAVVAPPEARGVEGMVLVPREPTQEMLDAPEHMWQPEAKKVWAAMLAAAPAAPAKEPYCPRCDNNCEVLANEADESDDTLTACPDCRPAAPGVRVEGKVIEPCVDPRGHFWRPVDGRTSQCTSCYVCASDDDFKATAIATRAERP